MKKPSKRKMYQKSRKKKKAEQRRKASQTTILPETTATASFYKYNNKQYQRNIPNYPTCNNESNSISSYSQGLQLWWQTYCSAIEFHTKQQNAWGDESKQRQLMLLEKYANEYETSSEEEEDDQECEHELLDNDKNLDNEIMNSEAVEDDVDEEYVKFLEVTHKHREELRLKRAAENI